MAYTVELSNRAKRDLASLSAELQTRIIKALRTLETNPRPSGIEKLKGENNAYRLRVGDYRILYEVYDKVLLVLVVKIGHRREVYRKR
ncbi:MAG: type II toxin-antitoxin system RelE family toxin [Candidatus Binatia bacterium]